jgi:Holliday junction DNA helicase RuvA
VGEKTASRIILELRGKLEGLWAMPAAAGDEREVIDALTALGYTVPEARKAATVVPVGGTLSLEDKVRLALEAMGRP